MPFLQHPLHKVIIHAAAYIQMSMTLSQASFLYCPLISGRDDGIYQNIGQLPNGGDEGRKERRERRRGSERFAWVFPAQLGE